MLSQSLTGHHWSLLWITKIERAIDNYDVTLFDHKCSKFVGLWLGNPHRFDFWRFCPQLRCNNNGQAILMRLNISYFFYSGRNMHSS